ncbi:ECF transporter S component [Tindallia californiensis]|uniref:Energy-coupling factor transport system substrate-specific component n=1 Tax=Tindallia californiensis TaxID=159292 RepID=A0A1H3QFH1_9FIRM|nr:ECF transporter S component [Tindallia californiensis]SDZ12060.1 energy-coupling factor transport system substrate-specific component [Tindallia californiensis]
MTVLPKDHQWTLKEIIVMSALGVAFAPLYMAWIQVWAIATGLLGPIGLDIVFGFWFIVSIICAHIFRKPGAALISEWIAAVVQIPLGSPSGAWLIVSGFVQGFGAEVPFWLTRYKKFNTSILMLSGVGASIASFLYNWFRFGYAGLAPGLLITMLVIRVISGAVLAGLLGKGIAEGLAATGVLSSFPLGKEWREKRRKSIHEKYSEGA